MKEIIKDNAAVGLFAIYQTAKQLRLQQLPTQTWNPSKNCLSDLNMEVKCVIAELEELARYRQAEKNK